MRRQLLTFALAGLFGAVLLSSDASACCFKKKCKTACAPAPCPTVVVAPCPPPVVCAAPAPVCARPRKKLFGGLCHKKPVCAVPVACATPVYAAAPIMPSGQIFPSGQHY